MIIKLIQPKMSMRAVDTQLKQRMAPHLGLFTLATLSKPHKVILENENIEKINFDEEVDLVGITVTLDTLPRAVEIAKRFKEKGVPVVAGGVHITSAYESIDQDAFDALGIGMAEGYWKNLLQDVQKNRLQPRYFCPQDLKGEDLVSPDYDLMKKKDYLYTNILHTSRGCPFSCSFCYNSSGHQPYLHRSISSLLEDIEKIGGKHLMFIDDNFIGDPSWTKKFLEIIKPMGFKWNAAVSGNIGTMPELLDLMKDSGCQSLFIGFESINRDSLLHANKRQNELHRYQQLIEALHSRGIMINASFVFGLEGDGPHVFKDTLDFIVSHKLETVTSHILTPYPGTRLYEEMEREGRITSRDLSLYNTSHVVFTPKGLEQEELLQGYQWIYKEVYCWKNIIKRLPRSSSQLMPYLAFNLLYRKYGGFSQWLCEKLSYQRIGRWGQILSRY